MLKWLRALNKDRHYRECARICEQVAHTHKNSHLLGAEINATRCKQEILLAIGRVGEG